MSEKVDLSSYDSIFCDSEISTLWAIFQYNNDNASGQQVILPSGANLTISTTCLYHLTQYGSHLVCESRSCFKDSKGTFDLTDIPSLYEYNDFDVILLFLMLSATQTAPNVDIFGQYRGYSSDKITVGFFSVASYILPDKTFHETMYNYLNVIYAGISIIEDARFFIRNENRYIDTVVYLIILNAAAIKLGYSSSSHPGLAPLLSLYPWTFRKYKSECITILSEKHDSNAITGSYSSAIEMFGDNVTEERALEYENNVLHYDIETEADGKKIIRIPAVAKKLGYETTEADNIAIGKTVIENIRRRPEKVGIDINGRRVMINAYYRSDFSLIERAVRGYFEDVCEPPDSYGNSSGDSDDLTIY